MFKDILDRRDKEQYKRYVDYYDKPPIEQDMLMLDFECMCRSHFKEWVSPTDFFTYKLKGIVDIANKYGINSLDVCDEFAVQLERRRK